MASLSSQRVRGQNEGLEKLGFPWILSSELSLFNGLRAKCVAGFFVFVSCASRAAPAGPRRLRSAGHDAPKYSGPIFHALPSEIASFESGLGRSRVPKPFIMRLPGGSGKKMSIILIHGFAAVVDGATVQRS